MTQVGPVCHIPPTSVDANKGPVSLPSIPVAQPNLASLTATVNALRQALIIFSGQMGAPGQQGAQGAAGKPAPSGSWTQGDIVSEKVKIFQNNDPTTGNFVEIERINQLTFNNKNTKQTIVFNRPPGG